MASPLSLPSPFWCHSSSKKQRNPLMKKILGLQAPMELTSSVVVRFIKKEIIYRYGLPRKIITDNATNLNNKMMKELCEDFKIQHHNSMPYRPKMNGAVEEANKNIKKIIQKMTVSYKDWHEMLPFMLHGYRTSARTSTGATPFALV